jgi:hypothetical protein
MSERNEVISRLRHAQADIQFMIDNSGDHPAKKHKYKSHLGGIEAVWYFLVQKHNWTPAVIRALNTDDLQFPLEEEMAGWTLRET